MNARPRIRARSLETLKVFIVLSSEFSFGAQTPKIYHFGANYFQSQSSFLLAGLLNSQCSLQRSTMAGFIDDQAWEDRYTSEELPSSDESDVSNETPLQNESLKRARRMLPLSDYSESDLEQPTKMRGKENREPFSSNKGTKRQRSETYTPGSSSNGSLLLAELRKTNKLIMSLSKKIKSQETRLKQIENKMQDATPKRTAKAKKEVPCEVRVSVVACMY